MPKKLNTPEIINVTAEDEHITSFLIDSKNNMLHITYDMLDAAGNVAIENRTHTIAGAEMAAAIARIDDLVATGLPAYAAIKQAIYEYLPGNGVIN